MTSQVMTWALSLVLTTLLARRLGPDGSGQLRLASAIWGIIGVFVTFGTGTLITVDLAREGKRSTVVNRAVGLQIILCLLGLAIAVPFVAVANYPPETTLVIAIMGLSVIPIALAGTGTRRVSTASSRCRSRRSSTWPGVSHSPSSRSPHCCSAWACQP